jgi:hypothetical protein
VCTIAKGWIVSFRILGNNRCEIGGGRLSPQIWQHLVGRGAVPVVDNQNRIVFVGREPFLLGLAATFSGRPADERLGALGRLEKALSH